MHPWAWPGSFHHCPSGCLGMQAQQQTSTHAGNILSRYGNPCKLDPCPSVCYLHVLTKAQGKETWALPEILPRLWTTIWQRKAIWKTYFQTNAQELSTLCIYPENSWTTQRMCQTKKDCLSQLMPNIFHPATYEEHPINNHDLHRVLFWKTGNAKKCIPFFTLDLG